MQLTLTDFVGPSRSSGTQINYQCCPVCGSQEWKLYLNPETGAWYCHAARHTERRGGVVDVGVGLLPRMLEALTGRGQVLLDWPEVALPPWRHLSHRASRYLRRRGVDLELANRLGIVEHETDMRLIVPYFGPAGRLIYWTMRSYSSLQDGPKYLTMSGRHPLYVLPRWQGHQMVVVVEGVFDAIAVHQHVGLPAVALGGKSLPKYLVQDFLGIAKERVVIVLDGDALGSALKLMARLKDKRNVQVVPCPPGQDPASIGAGLCGLFSGGNVAAGGWIGDLGIGRMT